MKYMDYDVVHKRIGNRIFKNKLIKNIFLLSTLFSLLVLGILIYRVVVDSIGWLDWQFLTSKLSMSADRAGIKGVIAGTLWLMAVVAPITMFLGIGTAIYLEEYAKRGKFQAFIQTNISNLAGVPSVIFGLLGLTVFGRMFNLGSSILAGGLTMSLLVLPIVVVASQEAIRAVPGFLREASYGMGATKWQTTKNIVLPAALPGILTGVILALSRAIGETAPLVVLGIPALIMPVPDHIMDDFTALPMQIYYWTVDSVLTVEYANLAAATIVVLLLVLFVMNSIAIIIRNKFQKRY
ncbi:phosphate ABC transporter membrane protein 2, PhoT family [Schinkia azotoformans MEV2011]|uniref:Phosphate transport system permease protein PstA n=1 Tax=Schinkia azotoformans MEV2011 TaxID=1348973 RepID=A0A072NN81_SCHAZ|nr:phosphate ABC transporter permease PstA [Schinkia azotoformans]KEF38712.1 phosphate ABC transporter membrane protein 2, PhoT family [Schinkia azotoformans MEV2011]MEC1697059.1 phosphate ABC transporter permease PstA [Schinkia azotoformans]MEC1718098.1 phosphate ABC transporter permease PstA [Schinkia azotoformans]MEC1727072.1 phosphate ABC transporter permease PstA [Schinkia azotoformans]MEC1743555.1 phosphate ABC transporter permease PstA [Schinkia azotoformans]